MQRTIFPMASCALIMILAICGLAVTPTKFGLDYYRLSLPGDGGLITGADFSPDNRLLTLSIYPGSGPNTIATWDLKNREWIGSSIFEAGGTGKNQLRHLQYSPGGERIVVLESDILYVLNSTSVKELYRIDFGLRHTGQSAPFVIDMKLSPNGRMIAVLISRLPNDRSGQLRLYDLETREVILDRSFSEHVDGSSLVYSPDSTLIAVVAPWPRSGSDLHVLDIKTGDEIWRLRRKRVQSAVFLNNNEILTAPYWQAFRMKQGSIDFWNIALKKWTRQITAAPGGVHYLVKLSRDGRYLLGYTGVEKRNEILLEPVDQPVDQKFSIWALPSGDLLATSPDILTLPGAVGSPDLSLILSSDGHTVFAYSPNQAYVFMLRPVPSSAGPN